MPRLTNRQPRLCHHKTTGRAVVYLDGQAHYCVRYGTPESRQRYRAILRASLDSQGARVVEPKPPAPKAPPTVVELLLLYIKHAASYYQSREVENLRDALRPV